MDHIYYCAKLSNNEIKIEYMNIYKGNISHKISLLGPALSTPETCIISPADRDLHYRFRGLLLYFQDLHYRSSWFEPNVENVGFLNQKIKIIRKNQASHFKNWNVCYPQGFGFQFTFWIVHINFNKVLTFEIEPKQRNVENFNQFKNK